MTPTPSTPTPPDKPQTPDTPRTPGTAQASGGGGAGLGRLDALLLTPGRFGVFAGEWTLRGKARGDRIPVRYLGILVAARDGWDVFACTRQVADAIVADHHTERDDLYQQILHAGHDPRTAGSRVDAELARIHFDGADIVVNEQLLDDDPRPVLRIRPDRRGLYVVMPGRWGWMGVDPDDCDRVEGTPPPPGREQVLRPLTHHPAMLVPDTRLTVTPHPTPAHTADIRVDNTVIGTVDLATGPARYVCTGTGSDVLRHHVDHCYHRGQPATVDTVLRTLAAEHDTHRALAAVTRTGGTLVRLVDLDDEPLTTMPTHPVPHGDTARRALVDLLHHTDRPPAGFGG